MEWHRIAGNWQHFKVLARVRWARISGDDFDLIAGRRQVLASQIQVAYRVSPEMALRQLEAWQGQQREPEGR
jgi:hypothetical protein